MPVLTDSQWNTIRGAADLILADLETGPNLEVPEPKPDNYWDFHFWLRGMRFRVNLQESRRITNDALFAAADRLAEAREVAGKILVNAPTRKQLREMEDSLRALSPIVAADQRFDATIKLAGNLADVIADLRGA